MAYKRILLKLSGESLRGKEAHGIDAPSCLKVALSLKELAQSGLEVALVIGGGNIFRGVQLKDLGLERTPADHMGMLATMMNGIALQQALAKAECPSKVFSAIDCPRVVHSYNWENAMESLDQGNITIFVGGTGNPYFTTDTAAAMRASEIKADILLKATKVDGIYDQDPMQDTRAKMYSRLTFSEALSKDLKVMDATAIALCRAQNIPIYVFNMKLLEEPHLSARIANQEKGTLVGGD